MLGGQAVFREKHPHPAGPSQPGSQLAVAAHRPELVTPAMQEQEHPAGIRSRSGQPVRRHPARGHLPHLHVVRHRAGQRGLRGHRAALGQRRRGLTGASLLPVPEGVDRVLHGLARHVGISFGVDCLSDTGSCQIADDHPSGNPWSAPWLPVPASPTKYLQVRNVTRTGHPHVACRHDALAEGDIAFDLEPTAATQRRRAGGEPLLEVG